MHQTSKAVPLKEKVDNFAVILVDLFRLQNPKLWLMKEGNYFTQSLSSWDLCDSNPLSLLLCFCCLLVFVLSILCVTYTHAHT